MNEPTIAILVPFMDSNYGPAACFTSLLKQDYPHLTIYLVGTSATIPVTWNRDNRFQHLESSSLLPQKLGFLIQQLDEDFILLLDPHDQLDQSTSLSKLINLAQQQNCDLIMPNFVKLQPDGTYIFPNLWRKPEELITHNNYHFLIKSIQAMRVLPGSLIKRSLLIQVCANLPKTASSQTIIRQLCCQARHGIYTHRHPYIWHLLSNHSLPAFE